MWMELLGLIIRRVLIIVLGNAAISAFLGPDVVNYILGDGTVAQIVAGVGTLALLLWSMRDKIIAKVRLPAAASGAPTTVAEVKKEVQLMPASEKLSEAFAADTRR